MVLIKRTTTRRTNRRPQYSLLLLGLLIAVMSNLVAAANIATEATGEWKLKEVWKANDEGPLSIREDGFEYVLRLITEKHKVSLENEGESSGGGGAAASSSKLNLSITVGNVLRSTITFVDEESGAIRVGLLMSTRMMPGSEEKRNLESYLSAQLPKMVSMEVKEGGDLILASEGSAKIVCERN